MLFKRLVGSVCLLGLAASLAEAAITVKVVGTSATQAILSYQAPDNNPCTISISENASLTPLVHDVDPSLFAGANSDSRAGSLYNGTTRVFVAGKRAAEKASDGNYYSRALQTATPHYYAIKCNGDSVSGSFQTMNIPFGQTYNDPLPVDPSNPGIHAWPTLNLNDRTQATVDPQTGVLIRHLTTTADGANQSWPAEGQTNFCADTTVTDPSGTTGTICTFNSTMYFIATTGDVRVLGTPQVWGYSLGWGNNATCYPDGLYDPTDPTKVYCAYGALLPDGTIATYAVLVQYHGNFTSFSGPLPLCDSAPQPCVTNEKLNPLSLTQIGQTIDPRFNPQNCTFQNIVNNQIGIHCTYTIQDTYGWMLNFDLASKTITSLASTLYSGGDGRWCSMHGAASDNQGWYFLSTNLLLGSSVPGSGPYMSHIVSGVLDAGASLVPCPPSSGTQAAECSVVTLDQQPTKPNPAAGELAQPTAIQVGDFLGTDLEDGHDVGGPHEIMRVVAVNGLSLTLHRGLNEYDPTNYPSFSTSFIKDHTSGSRQLWGICPGIDNHAMYWNFANDPWGRNADNQSWTLSSYFTAHGIWTPTLVVQPGYGVYPGSGEPEIWSAPLGYQISDNPPFHGITGLGYPNPVDSHPSLLFNKTWFLDGRPLNGGDITATNGQAVPADVVSGSLYHMTSNAYGGYSNAAYVQTSIDPKHGPVIAYCGNEVLKDISGPQSKIDGSAAYNYEYCVAKSAGECRAGSNVGDVYANCPNITQPYCNYWGIALEKWDVQDLCIAMNGAYTMGIPQVDATHADNQGNNLRLLTHGFNFYNRTDTYWNARLISNSNWFAFMIPSPNGAAINTQQQILLGKLPPWQGFDGVARNDFLSIPVPVSPPPALSVNNAVIQFGYAENGKADAYFCTSRQDACVKGNQSGTEFGYASESVVGMPCASGCTITIPAIAQRVVWFQVLYRDAGNNVIGQENPRTVVAEPPFTLSDGGSILGSLPTPVLNLPPYVSLSSQLSAVYPPQYNVTFQWSFTSEDAVSAARGAAALTPSASAPSYASGATLNMASTQLKPGVYLVRVVAIDSSGNTSSAADAVVTLVSGTFNNVRAYPNPWRSDKHGAKPLLFDGLTLDSTIKIFTVSGRLVKTLSAIQVIGTNPTLSWDLTNDSGDKVASGVYIYLIKDNSGNKMRGKVAVVK